MALNKVDGTLAQLTATGNTDAIDLVDAYSAAVTVRHTNGTGTITAGAIVQPEISHDGTNFYPSGGAFVFGTTESAVGHRDYVPPEAGFPIKAVRFAYTAPVGSSGHTLDVAFSKVKTLL
jgi:hypothetical protein